MIGFVAMLLAFAGICVLFDRFARPVYADLK
jgi:hypothetical protein